MSLQALVGTWHGRAELWLDPLGDHALWSDCTIEVGLDRVSYTWAHEATPHRGVIQVTADGGTLTDSFHAPAGMTFRAVAPTWALLDLMGSYTAGDGPPWGWRINVSHRPPWDGAADALLLQMTNVTPWGEDVRAVRMTARR